MSIPVIVRCAKKVTPTHMLLELTFLCRHKLGCHKTMPDISKTQWLVCSAEQAPALQAFNGTVKGISNLLALSVLG